MKKTLPATLRLLACIGVAAAACLFATAAHAQFSNGTISVDFNSTNDIGRGGSPLISAGATGVVTPGIWNEIDASTADGYNAISKTGVSLNTSTGAASGVTMAYNASFTFNADKTISTTAANNSPNYGLLVDYLASQNSETHTVTLSGLSATSTYRLVCYSAADAPGRATTFTVNGIAQTATFNANDTTFVAGHDYVDYTAAVPVNGVLTISFAQASGSGEGDFNGFELVAVPEPATWAGGLGAMALLGGVTLRRRGTRMA